MLRWEDERYIRFYTRDTLDWLTWSLEAQGLMGLIMRKVDRAGILRLEKHGLRGVAAALGHAHRWDVIEPALNELIADGCVVLRGGALIVRNFVAAQEAPSGDKARQATKRERDAAKALAKREGLLDDTPPMSTEDGHAGGVTEDGHAGGVTPTDRPCQPADQPSSPADAGAAAPLGGEDAEAEEFELTGNEDPTKPRAKSKHEKLRDHIEGLKFRWRSSHTDDYGFLATAKDCNTQILARLKGIEEREHCDRAKARELLIKAAVLYLRDEWPRTMDRLEPWDYRALFKLSVLYGYVDKAKKLSWAEDHPDDWTPA